MQLIRGNPLAIILVSSFFSIGQIIFLVFQIITGSRFNVEFIFILSFLVIFNYISGVVFFIAYKRAKYSFMSPKKYKKAIKQLDEYSLKLQDLREVIQCKDDGNRVMDDIELISVAVDIIKKQ